jgi:hypothetical protein
MRWPLRSTSVSARSNSGSISKHSAKTATAYIFLIGHLLVACILLILKAD